jgi:hypothetical protein
MCLAVRLFQSDIQLRIRRTLPELIGICIRESQALKEHSACLHQGWKDAVLCGTNFDWQVITRQSVPPPQGCAAFVCTVRPSPLRSTLRRKSAHMFSWEQKMLSCSHTKCTRIVRNARAQVRPNKEQRLVFRVRFFKFTSVASWSHFPSNRKLIFKSVS